MIINFRKIIFVSLLIYISEIAVVTAEMEEEVHSLSHNFPLVEQLSSNKLIIKRDKYLAKNNWHIGYNTRKNSDRYYIGWGQAQVKENPSSVNFADSKILAFESALLAAKGEFTRLSLSRIVTESVQEFFTDELSLNSDTSPGTVTEQIGAKVLALGGASLDSLLIKLDVNPADFTLKKKQNLAKDALTKTVTVKAVSNVSGVRPVVTFEDNSSVGVIIVYSQKLRDQAEAIARGQLVFNTKKIPNGLSISEQLNNSLRRSKDYVFQHGIRILKDEMGNPVLVSFAQSGVRATANTSKFQLDLALKASRSAAKNLSAAQMAEFINAAVDLTDKTVLAQSKLLDRLTQSDMISNEESLVTGKQINNYLKQVARIKLSGITTFKTWTANHPETGHLVVGEVAIWSPHLSHIARSINRKLKPAKSTPNVKNKIRTSVDFESDASF